MALDWLIFCYMEIPSLPGFTDDVPVEPDSPGPESPDQSPRPRADTMNSEAEKEDRKRGSHGEFSWGVPG